MIDDNITIPQQLHIEMTMRQRFPINQYLWHRWRQTARYQRHRTHLQRTPNHQQQITLALIFRHRLMKQIRQTFPEKHNIRLHNTSLHQCPKISSLLLGADRLHVRLTFCTDGDFLSEYSVSNFISGDFVATFGTGGIRKGTVTLDNAFDLGDTFQSVDVLCVVAEEFFLAFEEFYESEAK